MKQLYILLLAFLVLSLPLWANGQLPDKERELMGIKGPVRAYEAFYYDYATIMFEFDRSGNLLQVTEKLQTGEDPIVWEARIELDEDGRPLKTWLETSGREPYLLRAFEYHREGEISQMIYYPLWKNTKQVSIYGDDGQLATYQEWYSEDEMYSNTQIFYDEEGRRIYEEMATGPREVDFSKIHYSYTEQGFLHIREELNYWDQPNLTQEYHLDENGMVVGKTTTFGDGESFSETYWLDKWGNITEALGDYPQSYLYYYYED